MQSRGMLYSGRPSVDSFHSNILYVTPFVAVGDDNQLDYMVHAPPTLFSVNAFLLCGHH